jgi:hypothetical protein
MFKPLVIAAALAITPVAASAAAFTNGDFEAGLTGWVAGGTVNAFLGSVYADGISTAATPAQRANTYVFFGGGNVESTNTLSQTFDTVAGATYNFSFDVLAVGGNDVQNLSFDFGGVGATIEVTSFNDFSQYQTISSSFVASGPTSTVSFTNFSGFDGIDPVIDNVIIRTNGTGAVPEPATWAMLLAGFGLVGAVRRRQRLAQVAA